MIRPRTGFLALLAAEVISALGNRIAMVAIPWLVLVTTGDPAKMGLAAAAELVPYLLSGVFAAPVADRLGLRLTSIAADLGSAVAVAAIAMLPGFSTLIVLVVVTGTLRGVGDRAKHVLLRPMTEAAGFNIARVAAAYESLARSAMLVGAPLGGLLILWFSARGALWVDAVTFAVCAALVGALVQLRPRADAELHSTESEPYLAALRHGARYLRRDRPLSTMISLIFVANVFSQAATAVLIPVWASDVLHSPAALGAILGAYAAGGVAGSVVFTALASRLPRYPVFVIGLIIGDAPLLLILLTHNLSLVLVVAFASGVGVSTANPIIGAMQYERIPPELQNRVFGLVAAVCYAGLPVGGVLGGWAVAGLGLDAAVLLGGLLCLGLMLTLSVRARRSWEVHMLTDDNYVLRMLELFAEQGDREALQAGDCRMSYAELREDVLRLAMALREQGVRPGTRVAVLIMLPIEGPALQLALHLIGCRVVSIVVGSGRRETQDYLELTRPEVLIYDPRTSEELAGELLGHLGSVPVLCLGPGGRGPDLLAVRPQETVEPSELAEGAPESVFQTSGTTGTPKAMLHTGTMFRQSVALAEGWRRDGHPRLRHLCFTPLWWSAGTVAAMITLGSGGFLVIRDKWTPAGFLDTVREYGINYVFISPAMFYELLDDPALKTADCGSLYMLNIGAAPTTPERLRQGIERLGPVLRITYGLSESPYISALPKVSDDPPERLRSAGLPYGDVRVEIRDENGTVLSPGDTGEVWVATKLNFAGYLGQPELTAETLVDGWLRTRDLGYLDAEGYLYLVGRAQDMIVTGVGARKIFAKPIEDVLTTHPGVRAAAVIGVPDDALVEVVHAYLVPETGAEPELEELRGLVTDELAAICAPRSVEFVESLPVVGFGKVDKKALRAKYAAEHGAPVS